MVTSVPVSAAPAIATGLGLDAGGTATRWALADAAGRVVAEGSAAPLTALQFGNDEGRAHWLSTLDGVAAAAREAAQRQALPAAQAVVAGVTGFDGGAALAAWAAPVFALQPDALWLLSDIELECRAAFAPGAGAVVYAGTGSVAAHLDAAGRLHRAGGRGAVIDDAGSGHWIACRALRQVWRAEDLSPGAWQRSALAQQLFERIGGTDWAATRRWVYGADAGVRGRLGGLALAVAAAAHDADADADALALLGAAGRALAGLAQALLGRVGALPLALAGRVFDLHPAVAAGLRAALPAGQPVIRSTVPAHHAAARLAAAFRTPSP